MSTTETGAKLTPNQILALVVLMVEAREVNNNELKALAGFPIVGKKYAALEKHGLVVTDRSHVPYSHHLTDKGWRVARELPTMQPPKTGGSAIRSIFTLLANVSRSLDRLQISYGDFFKQAAIEEPPPPPAPVEDGGIESHIRAAYAELAGTPGGWVGLADLRENLGDLDRSAVDDTLRVMARRDGVRIIPLANSKALRGRDRAAALRIGSEDNHAVSIGSA